MLEHIKPGDLMFLDIETVPSRQSFDDLDPAWQMLWDKKSKQFRGADQTAAEAYERAGIYSDFGRIICISAGVITDSGPPGFRIKSFYGDDEKVLLSEFASMLNKFAVNRDVLLCAHNGKEFDYPYIARRMVINGLRVPDLLDNAGKKPWEVKLLDTMELWKFGDHKNYTSLELLTTVLGIPTPKDDIDGSMVAGIYWIEKDIKRIVIYCEKDVLAVAQVVLRFMNRPLIAEDRVESITSL
jgi:hypothetical protein